MSTVSLSSLEAKLAELANQIETFKIIISNEISYTIPYANIKLASGERYAGIVLKNDGEPSHHLILLPSEVRGKTWKKAHEWALNQRGDLPTRDEQSLLFANLKGEFQDAYYWSCETDETNSSWAWCQDFRYGYQTSHRKGDAFRARAVRRVMI